LTGLAQEARNLISGVDAIRRRDAYLTWAETAETQLRNLFDTPDVWMSLLTDRYWHIRGMDADTARPAPLVGMGPNIK